MSAIRFSGIASGMDTETMVKQLMDAEKIRLNKYNQEKQIKKWTQEAYNDVNKDIANFILDSKKDLGVSTGGSISSASWIKEATSSDTSIFGATANSSAVPGTHSIKVTQLAQGVNKASQSALSAPNNTLADLDAGITDGTINFEIEVDGTTKTVTVNYKSTDSLSDLAENINKATTADGDPLGLQATYDSTAKRFFLSTKTTGSSSQIKITSDTQNLFVDPDNGDPNNDSKLDINLDLGTAYQGQNAKIDFDGAIGIEYESNNFTINGINIDLKSADAGTEYTIKVDTDVDAVYDKIKGFVDKYNQLIDKLNNKTSEKTYRDYKPLSDEEKEAMDEKTIELWEEKAKSGLLRNDEHITNLLADTRSGLYESVYSDFDNSTELSGFSFLGEIGITTGSYQDKGKLEIDEITLKQAITNDVDGVMDLLFKTPDSTTTDEEKRAETGLINRLYDDMIDGMKNIIEKSGTGDNASLYREVKSTILIDFVTEQGSISLLDKDVVNIEKQISAENRRLTSVEDRYWRQFTAMEKAMNEMNSQSSWLMSQMGGM